VRARARARNLLARKFALSRIYLHAWTDGARSSARHGAPVGVSSRGRRAEGLHSHGDGGEGWVTPTARERGDKHRPSRWPLDMII